MNCQRARTLRSANPPLAAPHPTTFVPLTAHDFFFAYLTLYRTTFCCSSPTRRMT